MYVSKAGHMAIRKARIDHLQIEKDDSKFTFRILGRLILILLLLFLGKIEGFSVPSEYAGAFFRLK